jgi:hypothetical protein
MVKEEHIFLWTILAAFAKLFLYGSSSARHNPPQQGTDSLHQMLHVARKFDQIIG